MFLVFALASLVSLAIVQAAFAHELSIALRWHSSTVTVKDLTSSYSAHVNGAVSDYNNNTDMSWSKSSNGRMIFVEMDLGHTGWEAAAIAETPVQGGYDACMEYPSTGMTGACNTTDRKAHRAHIYFNTYNRIKLDAIINTAVIHEPGHAIGMAHTECNKVSVMKRGTCGNLHTILKPHDKNHINDWY